MTTFQALMLGMTMAWAPSLIGLAYLLVCAPEIECDDEWTSAPSVAEAEGADRRVTADAAGG